MLKQVLLSFVGSQDPKSRDHEDGPILTMAAIRHFDIFVLLYTNDKNTIENTGVVERLLKERNPDALVMLFPLSVDDPTSYSQLLSAMREVSVSLQEHKTPREYFVSVASGTPAMHACWILLAASGEIPANILYLRRPQHVKDGQPLLSEINPRTREFPLIRSHATMEDLPDLKRFNMENAVKEVGIIGESPCLRQAIDDACRYARSDHSVLITGETGTGKELFAKLIYNISKRQTKLFLPINCGAISSELVESALFGHIKGAFTGAITNKKGAFEAANGGVLFLDEIGDIPLPAQVKLLRVLNDMTITPVGSNTPTKVDVRIIAATHRNLKEEIASGRFREDLFHRLAVLTLTLPPLRERGGDIIKIALSILDKCNKRENNYKSFTPKALEEIRLYDWPGNVRDLTNIITRTHLLAQYNEIDTKDLWKDRPLQNRQVPELPAFYEGFSVESHINQYRQRIYEAALEAGRTQVEAANILGVTPQMVSKYIKRTATTT